MKAEKKIVECTQRIIMFAHVEWEVGTKEHCSVVISGCHNNRITGQ